MWHSVPDLVRDAAVRFSAAEAVTDEGLRWTFAELAEEVERAARGVIAAGLGHGERAAIWAPNTAEWVVAALGVLSAGGVLVPINTRYKGPEAAYILERSKARLLFTVRGFLDTDYPAMLADAELPNLRRVILLHGDADDEAQTWPAFLDEGTVTDLAEARRRAAAVGPDDLSDVMFTSGTTGRPKGVMATHGQTLRVFEVWSRHVGLRQGDRYLIVNPFFHTFGYKAGILAAVMRGAAIIPHPVFDPDTVLRRIAEERVSMLPGPPTLYQSLLAHPERDKHDLGSLRLAVTGAAVVPVELVRRMSTDLGFETVLTAYGLTEATGVVSMCSPDDDFETIAGTCGRAIPDTEIRIVDDDGNPLAFGDAGEVIVRGYNVMRGYLDDPEQTAAAVDVDGWLHTGDVGVLDELGYLRITDRKKDMFIVGGFNAYPAEIENELLAFPGVAQVAVVGVPDDRLGEVGMAFVVPRQGEQIAVRELVAWAKDRMANFKVPRRVAIVDALPLNASGKVLKHELRARALEY